MRKPFLFVLWTLTSECDARFNAALARGPFFRLLFHHDGALDKQRGRERESGAWQAGKLYSGMCEAKQPAGKLTFSARARSAVPNVVFCNIKKEV